MVDSGGGNMHRVYSKNLVDPSWSPSGDWIAYYTRADIWKVHTTPAGLDTTTDQQLTFRQSFFSPVWNPTSTWLLFFQPDGGGAGLYRLGSLGGAPELLPGSYRWRNPDWSRDSTKLVFIMDYNDSLKNAIGVSNADAQGLQVVHLGLRTPYYPKWSPDGTKITFVDRDIADEQIYLWIMDADGRNLHKVTSDTVGSGYCWSPDGTEIAYVRFSYDDHSYQNGTIHIVNVSTGVSRQLTFNAAGISRRTSSSR
jgi:Tol biopolymer transport system component